MSDISSFDRRVRELDRKRSRIAKKGYAMRVGRDGLVTMVPRRRRPRFPLGAIVSVLAVAFAFKAVLLASMGTESYEAKLSDLGTGSLAERAGAWVLQPDPLSLALVTKKAAPGVLPGAAFFLPIRRRRSVAAAAGLGDHVDVAAAEADVVQFAGGQPGQRLGGDAGVVPSDHRAEDVVGGADDAVGEDGASKLAVGIDESHAGDPSVYLK